METSVDDFVCGDICAFVEFVVGDTTVDDSAAVKFRVALTAGGGDDEIVVGSVNSAWTLLKHKTL